MKTRQLVWSIVFIVIGALVISACGPAAAPEAPAAQAEEAELHEEEGGHTHSPDQHMAAQHDVPADAAAVPNPIAANAESMAAGGQFYAASCAVCHGEGGLGDGPGAAGLEKPPANLTEAHVQELSDGALFYIISHGRPDTPMPAWENLLDEEQRWQVVNYLRTFKDGEHLADDDHHEEGDHHAGEELQAEAEHHEEEEDHHD
jgi:mono/diheme cytochrome c family protein